MSNNLPALVSVPFHGDTISVIPDADGVVYVPIKKICGNLGVNYPSQVRNLRNHHWAVILKMRTTAADGKTYSCSCLPLNRLPMWLAQINVGMVHPTLRQKLIRYQLEAADMLHAHFFAAVVARTDEASVPVPFIPFMKQRLDALGKQLDKNNVDYRKQYLNVLRRTGELEARIAATERATIQNDEWKTATTISLEDLPDADSASPYTSPRALVVSWVNSWVKEKTAGLSPDHSLAWRRVLDAVDKQCRIRCRIRARNQCMEALDLVDDYGLMPAIYATCQTVLPRTYTPWASNNTTHPYLERQEIECTNRFSPNLAR